MIIGTAHMILQNMNRSVDPCQDFYQVKLEENMR